RCGGDGQGEGGEPHCGARPCRHHGLVADTRVTALTPGAAKKALGQHFLFDAALLGRIAIAGGPVEGTTVIEVGPGPGGLTRALLDAGVKKLIAVELDDRFADGLSAWP